MANFRKTFWVSKYRMDTLVFKSQYIGDIILSNVLSWVFFQNWWVFKYIYVHVYIYIYTYFFSRQWSHCSFWKITGVWKLLLPSDDKESLLFVCIQLVHYQRETGKLFIWWKDFTTSLEWAASLHATLIMMSVYIFSFFFTYFLNMYTSLKKK